MKNKKLLNFYMLSIALLAVISFLLPIEKLNVASQSGLLVMLPYYIFSGIMVLSLAIIIIIALLNMFKNEYEAVQPMKAFSFIAFLMVLLIFVIYSTQLNYALSWGFLLIATEVFGLFVLIPVAKTISTFKNFSYYMQTLFPKREVEESERKVKVKTTKKIKKSKSKPVIIKKGNEEKVVADNNPTESETVLDPTTGETK